jgi:putative salt-induced outer membrane protein YdiY
MRIAWRLSPLIFYLCLMSEARGQDLQAPFPFSAALPPGTPPPPLIAPPEVQRLPPVGENPSPMEWVAAPPPEKLYLEPSLQPVPDTPLSNAPPNGSPPGGFPPPPPSSFDAVANWPLTIRSEEPPPVKLWEGSLSVGLDGAEGNNQAMNLRVGFDARRKTELHLLYLNADYNRRTVDNENAANRLFSQIRYERIIKDTDWSIFVGSTYEYDEFEPWDFRLTSHSGLGRWLFRNEVTSLKARFGGGFSREIYGPRSNYTAPELIVGMDFERKLSTRQRLIAMFDYMPDVTDFTEFRFNSQAGWEVLLDKDPKLTLRLAVRNRYTSTPGTALPNDLDYAALLLWTF